MGASRRISTARLRSEADIRRTVPWAWIGWPQPSADCFLTTGASRRSNAAWPDCVPTRTVARSDVLGSERNHQGHGDAREGWISVGPLPGDNG